MMNYEVAVEAIYEAREVLADVELGASKTIASEKAGALLLLAAELDGDNKNAVYVAARALDAVANHPDFVDDEKELARAIRTLNGLIEQAAQIAAEEWVFRNEEDAVESIDVEEPIEEVEVEEKEESLYDLLASIDDDYDDDDWDFDDDEDEGCGADDVEYEYNNAVEGIDEKLGLLEDQLDEYTHGARKDDDDAYEQAYQLKADIRYAQQKRNEIEDLLESYKAGEIDAWTAQDRIYKKFSLID